MQIPRTNTKDMTSESSEGDTAGVTWMTLKLVSKTVNTWYNLKLADSIGEYPYYVKRGLFVLLYYNVILKTAEEIGGWLVDATWFTR